MHTADKTLQQPAHSDSTKSPELDSLLPSHRRYRYFATKYRIERALGCGLLVLTSPIILLCWSLVKITSRGPGIYRQTRVGYEGTHFQVFKLRTMRMDAEANGPQWSSAGDSRITWLGRVLRKLHLDELPQLLNVARGEMVLVGPRPERPEFVALLTAVIPGYERRLAVKPGITGLAQINLPPDTDLRSVERKQILDLHHIDNADFWLDKRMVLLTALRLFFISHDRLTKLMGLDRKELVAHLPAKASNNNSMPLSILLQQTSPNINTVCDVPSQDQEEDPEASAFHANWDQENEHWDDDTHDSWEGMSLSENSP